MLEITQGQISRYENKGEQPAKDLASEMATILNVNLDYLYGKTHNAAVHPLDRKIDVESLSEKDLEQLKAFKVVLEYLDKDKPLVPVYDRFVEQDGEYLADYISEYKLNDCKADYVVKMSDSSMEPMILEGALLYIKEEDDLSRASEKIGVLIDLDGYPVVRKIVLKDELVALLTFNNGWNVELMTQMQLEEHYKLLGVMLKVVFFQD
jgi:transcriptional regulator with XRE-family HTH domain